MEDNIIVFATSLICIFLVFIKYRYISQRGGLIDAIVFAVYSAPLYFWMFTAKHGEDAFVAWGYLIILSAAQAIIIWLRVLIFYIPKLLEYIRNRK